MPPSKIRFVTACQQLLALGRRARCADPGGQRRHPRRGPRVARRATAARAPALAGRPQRPTPRASARTVEGADRGRRPDGRRVRPDRARGRQRRPAAERRADARPTLGPHQPGALPGSTELISTPQPVDRVRRGRRHLGARRRGARGRDRASRSAPGPATSLVGLDGRSSYHADHGPDPGSAEARHARPGTDALLVGDVDEVQVRVASSTERRPPGRHEARRHRPRQGRPRPPSRSPPSTPNTDGRAPTAAPDDAGPTTDDRRQSDGDRRLGPDRPAGGDVHARSR